MVDHLRIDMRAHRMAPNIINLHAKISNKKIIVKNRIGGMLVYFKY